MKINGQWVDSFKDDLYLGLMESENSDPGKPSTDAFMGVTDTMRKYHLQVPKVAVLMIKVIMMLGDDISKLYPEFNFLVEVRPYLGDILRDSVLSQARKTVNDLSGMQQEIFDFPQNLNEASKRISIGGFKFRFVQDDIYQFERRIDRAGYRILLGLVLASVLIGLSSMVFTMKNILSSQYLGAMIGVYIASILIAAISAFFMLKSR